jgi:hypothetical protein
MAEIRSDVNQFLLESLTANEAIDISSYDRVGRFTTDAEAALCGADETPQFLFMESADADAPVRVAFLGMGQVQLALSGSGSAGQKLSAGANGVIVASATAENAEMDEDDFGVALQDWVDGDETECFIYKGSKV